MEINFASSIDELENEFNGIFYDFFKDFLDKCETGGFCTYMNLDDYLKLMYKQGFIDKSELNNSEEKYLFNILSSKLIKVSLNNKRIIVTKYKIDNDDLDKYIEYVK